MRHFFCKCFVFLGEIDWTIRAHPLLLRAPFQISYFLADLSHLNVLLYFIYLFFIIFWQDFGGCVKVMGVCAKDAI